MTSLKTSTKLLAAEPPLKTTSRRRSVEAMTKADNALWESLETGMGKGGWNSSGLYEDTMIAIALGIHFYR